MTRRKLVTKTRNDVTVHEYERNDDSEGHRLLTSSLNTPNNTTYHKQDATRTIRKKTYFWNSFITREKH